MKFIIGLASGLFFTWLFLANFGDEQLKAAREVDSVLVARFMIAVGLSYAIGFFGGATS